MFPMWPSRNAFHRHHFARLGQLVLELLFPTQQVLGRESGRRGISARRCARPGSRACRACAPAPGPGVPPGTMNNAWPRWPSSSSTTALTTWTSAIPPLPIHILWPSRIQSLPSRRAVVRRFRTSLPPSGSEIASAASLRSPGVPKHCGAHSSICSGEAACPIADSASAGMTMAKPIPAQPQNSSSMNIGSDSPLGSPIRSR